jgi:3-methyladenine DNA glycosylase AlkD
MANPRRRAPARAVPALAAEAGPAPVPAPAGGQAFAPAAAEWERELRRLGTAERAAREKAYLKSDLEFAGVPVPAMRAIVAAWCKARPGLGHDEVTELVRTLWASPLYECRQCAVILLERTARLLGGADLVLLEYLLRTSRTWALVDGLAANVAGGIVDRDPGLGAFLDRWARDDDFWLRRSAMLALMRPMRRDDGAFDRFGGYADAMLEEKEFFIRKAIGWVLRDTATRRPGLVAAWLGPRVHRASGVTVREAVKPLPADVRAILLAGYRDKRPVRCEHEGTDLVG